jgi:hypothetical protein
VKSQSNLFSLSSIFFSLYWPYKFWQHQRQSKIPLDTNDTCERATSPVRFLTPAKRSSVSSISNRSNQSTTDTRLSTSMTTNNDHSSQRGNRVLTADLKSISVNSRGKNPLI